MTTLEQFKADANYCKLVKAYDEPVKIEGDCAFFTDKIEIPLADWITWFKKIPLISGNTPSDAQVQEVTKHITTKNIIPYVSYKLGSDGWVFFPINTPTMPFLSMVKELINNVASNFTYLVTTAICEEEDKWDAARDEQYRKNVASTLYYHGNSVDHNQPKKAN